jgi:hypothetical protein
MGWQWEEWIGIWKKAIIAQYIVISLQFSAALSKTTQNLNQDSRWPSRKWKWKNKSTKNIPLQAVQRTRQTTTSENWKKNLSFSLFYFVFLSFTFCISFFFQDFESNYADSHPVFRPPPPPPILLPIYHSETLYTCTSVKMTETVSRTKKFVWLYECTPLALKFLFVTLFCLKLGLHTGPLYQGCVAHLCDFIGTKGVAIMDVWPDATRWHLCEGEGEPSVTPDGYPWHERTKGQRE